MMLKVPYRRQKWAYTCGPASVQMIFAYWKKRLTADALERRLKTSRKSGTGRRMLVKVARHEGFRVQFSTGGTTAILKKYLAAGIPVIINFVEPSEGEGHYAVLTGVSGTFITMNDPWSGKGSKMAVREFIGRWKRRNRWFMAVFPRRVEK